MGQLLLSDEQVGYVGDPAAEDAQNDGAYGYGALITAGLVTRNRVEVPGRRRRPGYLLHLPAPHVADRRSEASGRNQERAAPMEKTALAVSRMPPVRRGSTAPIGKRSEKKADRTTLPRDGQAEFSRLC